MADNKSMRGPQDATRINTSEDYEVRYWCEQFECSPEQLRAAVAEVGVRAEDVAAFFDDED